MLRDVARLGWLVATIVGLGSVAACTETSTTVTPGGGTTSDGGVGSTDPTDPTPEELASGGSCPTATGEGTTHSGILKSDEVWTAAGSPHRITSSLDIRAKVTIEPCARVIVGKSAPITVGSNSDVGSLVAKGTATVDGSTRDIRPIVFEAEDPTSGWPKLEVDPKGTADLSLVALLDGGSSQNDALGALIAYGVAGGTNDGEVTRNLTVDRVLVQGSKSYGVNLLAWGAFTAGSDKLWIRGGGSDTQPSAILIEPGVASTLPKKLFVSGNAKDEILVQTSKAFMRDDTFVARGVPYHAKGAIRVNPGKDAAPVKLTIEAGVTIGFEDAAGSGIFVGTSETRQGVLEAVGTAEAPIVFTSAKASKAPGDWMSLYFKNIPASGNRVENARIEYAGGESGTNSFGCGPKDNDGAVFIGGRGSESAGPSSAFIASTTFENIAGTTVIVSGWISDDGPNFKGDNVFGAGTPSCKVSRPKRSGAGDVCDGGRDVCW